MLKMRNLVAIAASLMRGQDADGQPKRPYGNAVPGMAARIVGYRAEPSPPSGIKGKGAPLQKRGKGTRKQRKEARQAALHRKRTQ